MSILHMIVFEIADVHGDKSWLLFLYVQVLNESFFFEFIEIQISSDIFSF